MQTCPQSCGRLTSDINFQSISNNPNIDPLKIVTNVTDDSQNAHVKIAYLVKSSGIRYKNIVKQKCVLNHCTLYHSGINQDKYCYFYLDIFDESKKVQYYTTGNGEAYIGSHITFGPKNRQYYLHNTEYYITSKTEDNAYLGKGRVCWYLIDNGNLNLTPSRCQNNRVENMWKLLKAAASIQQGGVGDNSKTPFSQGPYNVPTPATIRYPQPNYDEVFDFKLTINTDDTIINGIQLGDIQNIPSSFESSRNFMWFDGGNTYVIAEQTIQPIPFDLTGGKHYKALVKYMQEWEKQGMPLEDLFKGTLSTDSYKIMKRISQKLKNQSR